MGVNLVVTNKKEGIGSSSERWILGVKKSNIIENPAVRIKYRQGQSSLNERFPLYTSDEKGHAEMLFPGESIEYHLDVPPKEVPYFHIQVEGTLSRRHLFHVVRELNTLSEYINPLIEEIFADLDKIQIVSRLTELTKSISVITPDSSFEDLDKLKENVQVIASEAGRLMDEMNIVYRANKHIDAKAFIKQVWGKHIVSVKEACKTTQEAFPSGDARTIADAANRLKSLLSSSDECTRKQSELIASFDL